MARITVLVIALSVAALAFAAADALAQTTRGCNLPPQFPCPDARIMSFDADRASIKPGDSVVLTWVAENPGAMSVTPGIGAVIARGSARVTPAATTTYTLSVGGGPNGQVLTRTVTVTVAGTTPVATATSAPAATQGVPRMVDGRPNLQGVFSTFGARGAGPGRGGTPPAPGALPRTPTLKPGMESYRVAPSPGNVIVSDCVVGSVPPSFGPYSFQIIQTPEYVVLFYEYMHLFRIVPIHDGPHQPGESWMGDSIGRWDGETFVVDTVGFNLKSTVGGGDRHQPFRHSDQLHMVERIRRLDLNTIEIETRLEDPKVFEGPWGWVSRYAYHPEFKRVEEYMCAENTKDYDYLLDPKKEVKP